MTTSARQPRGIPVGGQFAATAHAESGLTLNGPRVDASFVHGVLSENLLHRTSTPEMTEEIVARLNASRNFSDQNVADTADAVWRETYGHTAQEESSFKRALDKLVEAGETDAVQNVKSYVAGKVRKAFADGAASGGKHADAPDTDLYTVPGANTLLHVLHPETVADGKKVPVPATDPRLQAGEVFDRVTAEDQTFVRASVSDYPQDTQAIRFQANRPLTDGEAYALSGAVGYANRAAIGGEPLDDPQQGPSRDTPYSFIAHIDTNKGRQGDFGKFEAMIPDIIANGSPIRPTKGNTRAIEAFGDTDLKLEIYYAE